VSLNKTFPNGFFLLRLYKGPSIPSKIGTVVELHARISNAVASLIPQMLENIWCEIEYRCEHLQDTTALTLRSTEFDELFSQAEQPNFMHLLYSVF
jgi:hypothetical protein